MAWLWSCSPVASSLPFDISLGRYDIKILLHRDERCRTARARTFPARMCPHCTGRLPGGAHAVVVKWNDRDVHGTTALRCRAQLDQSEGFELRFRLRRLVGHGSLLIRDAQR